MRMVIINLIVPMQVDFPERPGALRSFLSVVVPTWNLTLFHYRKSGNRQTPLLIGIQVPPATAEAFEQAQKTLGDDFSFTPLSESARGIFDKFISWLFPYFINSVAWCIIVGRNTVILGQTRDSHVLWSWRHEGFSAIRASPWLSCWLDRLNCALSAIVTSTLCLGA